MNTDFFISVASSIVSLFLGIFIANIGAYHLSKDIFICSKIEQGKSLDDVRCIQYSIKEKQ